jgi:hypothetical protein
MFRNLLYSAFGILGSREAKALEQASLNPAAAQLEKLMEIISANAETVYGKEHKFGSIKTAADFQNAVPINEYDTLQPYITRVSEGEQNVLTSEMPFMFATTSGTTGARKLIPITRSYVKEFRRASVSSGYHLLRSFPGVAKGVTLSVFSPAEEGRTPADIPYGAISGRLYLEEPPLVKKYVSPLPYELFLIKDYESRYYTLLRCALMLPISSIYTLNPSTIVVLARRLNLYAARLIEDVEHGTLTPPAPLPEQIEAALQKFLKPDSKRAAELKKLLTAGEFKPRKIWKNLSLICCWTRAAAAFYLQDLPEFFGDLPVCDITYGASEGRGTVCIAPGKQLLALRSHFFEFVPEDEIGSGRRPLLAHELTLGENYYILFTTAGGLYRYNINDIVKVAGWHNKAPLIEFLHKGGNISSFTGEKLTESQVTEAVSAAIQVCGIKLRFFTVIPKFRPEPHYELWCEPFGEESSRLISSESTERLRQEFDKQLRLKNIEYEAKRQSDRLADTTVEFLAVGAYEELRKHLVAGGVPDAQVKISHLNPKEEILKFLENLKDNRVAASPKSS